MTPSRDRLLMAHAFLWATLMIASAFVLRNAAAPEVSSWLLTVVYVPLWWASDQLLQTALRRQQRQPA